MLFEKKNECHMNSIYFEKRNMNPAIWDRKIFLFWVCWKNAQQLHIKLSLLVEINTQLSTDVKNNWLFFLYYILYSEERIVSFYTL